MPYKKKNTDRAQYETLNGKKLFIETYGCQMNVADSEVIASVMQMAGYSVAETLEEADAVFMNTCSIRDNAEQKILNRLEFFHSLKKKKKHLNKERSWRNSGFFLIILQSHSKLNGFFFLENLFA